MAREPEELPEGLEALFAEARRAPPPADAIEALRRNLGERLKTPVPSPAAGLPVLPLGLATAALLLGAVAWWAFRSPEPGSVEHRPAERSDAPVAPTSSSASPAPSGPSPMGRADAPVDAPVAPTSSSASPAPSGPSPMGRADAPVDAPVAPAPSSASPAPSRSSAAASELPERRAAETSAPRPPPPTESELLDEAQAALSQAPRRTLRLTRAHARRYPHGLLVQEREVLAIRALLRLRSLDAAEQRLGEFEQRWPTSAHLAGLRQLLREGESASP